MRKTVNARPDLVSGLDQRKEKRRKPESMMNDL